MPSDLIVLTASNGENRKLAERFVQAAAAAPTTKPTKGATPFRPLTHTRYDFELG